MKYLDETGLAYFWNKIKSWIQGYVPPVSSKAKGFFIGKLDTTSTRTVMTAQVDGITELYSGLTILMDNNVAQSNTNVTLNVNSLGAKKMYNNMNDTALTTQWAITTTALLYYDETRDGGNGGWVWYFGYDTNTNTIGYQLRTNATKLPTTSQLGRYRLMFTSADGTHFVPANSSSSTGATGTKTPTTTPIDPFGRIVYYGYTTVITSGSMAGAGYMFDQNSVTMGYSFTPISMNDFAPVYLKTTPQANGSVVIDPTHPYVQTLPTTDDGYVYIFLGVATSTTVMELVPNHPCYWYKDGAVRLYTGQPYIPQAPTTNGTYTLSCTVSNGVATYSWN